MSGPVTSGPSRPAWMQRVEDRLQGGLPDYFQRFAPPDDGTKESAVLMLFAPGPEGEEVLLTERSHHLRSHPGQVSFPGGSLEEVDAGPVDAALREAHEEVGVVPTSVDVVLSLPRLWLTPSQQAVTPVLGWWPEPGDITSIDPIEVARAATIPVAHLLDPDRRFTVTHPLGYRGPGFEADGLFVWGFTAMLLDALFEAGGLAPQWDQTRERPLPDRLASPWMKR